MVFEEMEKEDVPILHIHITEDCPAHEVELQFSPKDNDDDVPILNIQITDECEEHEVELLHTLKDINNEVELLNTPKDGDGSPILDSQITEEAPAHEVDGSPQDNDDDSLNSDQSSSSSLCSLDKKQKRRFLRRFRQSHVDNGASSTKRRGKSLSIKRPLRLGKQNKLSPNSSSTDSTSENSQSKNKNKRSTSLSANLQKFGSEISKTEQVDDVTNMSVATEHEVELQCTPKKREAELFHVPKDDEVELLQTPSAHETELLHTPKESFDNAPILDIPSTEKSPEHEVELLHTIKDSANVVEVSHSPQDNDGHPILDIRIADEAPAHEVEILYTPQDEENDDESLKSAHSSLGSLRPLDKKQGKKFRGTFGRSRKDDAASPSKGSGRMLSIKKLDRLGKLTKLSPHKLSPNSSTTDTRSVNSESTNKSERSNTGIVDDVGNDVSASDKPPRGRTRLRSVANSIRRIGHSRRGGKKEELDDGANAPFQATSKGIRSFSLVRSLQQRNDRSTNEEKDESDDEGSLRSQSTTRSKRSLSPIRRLGRRKGRSRHRENDYSDDDGSVRSTSTFKSMKSLNLKKRLLGSRRKENDESSDSDDDGSVRSISSFKSLKSLNLKERLSRSRRREYYDSNDDGSVYSKSTRRRRNRSMSLSRGLSKRGRSKSRVRSNYERGSRRHRRNVLFDDRASDDESHDNQTVKAGRYLPKYEDDSYYSDEYDERKRSMCTDADDIFDYWSNSCDEIYGLIFFKNKESKSRKEAV